MSDWHERLKDRQAGALATDQLRILGEVGHAVGNLVHRMYYWAAIVEESLSGDGPAREAIKELTASLSILHRLINRTMHFLRPVTVRPISVAASDIVRSIALRLGAGEIDQSGSGQASTSDRTGPLAYEGYELAVDPVQFDRAMGMLAEVFHCRRGSSALRLSVALKPAPLELCCSLSLAPLPGQTTDGVEAASQVVGRALAEKILHESGWRLAVRGNGEGDRLVISIPLRRRREARRGLVSVGAKEKTDAVLDRSSGDTLDRF